MYRIMFVNYYVMLFVFWLFWGFRFFVCFLAFDFCQFCVLNWFFHPHHNSQWPLTSKNFLSQIVSIIM